MRRVQCSPFSIIIEKDIPLSAASLSTVFYVKLDNYCFPDCLWTDLTYNVLMMWVSAIFSGSPSWKNRTLHFMDGPYRIEIEKVSDEKLSLQFMRYDTSLHTGACTYAAFLSGMQEGLNAVYKIIVTEHASNPQFDSIIQDIVQGISLVQQELQRQNRKHQ